MRRILAELTILVADDFAPWRALTRRLLQQRLEWHIVEACDGLEAVEKATELRPDIVLLDVGMPVMNGIEVAKCIQQNSPTSKIIFATQNKTRRSGQRLSPPVQKHFC